MERAEVLVLGAGVGGLVAANLLAAEGYSVTVVEKSSVHLFQPGMLWIAFKGHSPSRYTRSVESLLDPRVRLVRGRVSRIDLAERLVALDDGRSLGYDRLIVALGAGLDYDAVPGHRRLLELYGDFFAGAEAARRLWENFSSMSEGTLLIGAADPLYKCPPAPHKAALLAADTLRRRGLLGRVRVVLALPFPREYPAESLAGVVGEKLRSMGVEVRTLFTVDSIDIENRTVSSLEGETIGFDVAAIIPFHTGPSVEVEPAEAVDDDGFFKVDKYTLEIAGYDDAYAIGDCSNAPTSKTGVTAHLAAEVVADRIAGLDSRFTGRTNCPIVADGEALFVISDYSHPPLPARFTRAKRLMEDLFIAAYWSSLRHPERWRSIFHAYFSATEPSKLAPRGW